MHVVSKINERQLFPNITKIYDYTAATQTAIYNLGIIINKYLGTVPRYSKKNFALSRVYSGCPRRYHTKIFIKVFGSTKCSFSFSTDKLVSILTQFKIL